MEQMQARERALQARAAAAAAQNANLLQNLDAFRGVHLDPNAHHWDEVRLFLFSFRSVTELIFMVILLENRTKTIS